MPTSRQPAVWWVALSAAAMVVGAVGPWVRIQLVARNGLDDGDGWIVVVAAAVAGAMLLLHRERGSQWPLLVAAFCGVLGVVVFLVNADGILWNVAINEIAGKDVVSARWGFFVVVVASASLFAASLALYALAARGDGATSAAQSP